jgi:hypothetical protein
MFLIMGFQDATEPRKTPSRVVKVAGLYKRQVSSACEAECVDDHEIYLAGWCKDSPILPQFGIDVSFYRMSSSVNAKGSVRDASWFPKTLT